MLAVRLLAVVACVLPFAGHAKDTFPSHKMVLVVPYSPGGGVDTIARALAKSLSETFHQPVIVENRPGSGGTIGAAYVAHSPADGYTLLVAGTSPVTIAPFFMKTMPFDTKDIKLVSTLVSIPQILVVKANGPLTTFPAFESVGKSKPITVAGTQASGQQLAILLLAKRANLNIQFVPYKGTSDAVTAVLSGVVDAAYVDPSVDGLLKAGTLKALAVSTLERSPSNPQIPTLAEVGVKNAAFPGFYGVLASSHTKPDIMAKLNAAIQAAMADPIMQKYLISQGLDPDHSTPAQAQALIDSQTPLSRELLTPSTASAN